MVGLVAVVKVVGFAEVVGEAVAVWVCVGESFVLLFDSSVSAEVGDKDVVGVGVCSAAVEVVSVPEFVDAGITDVVVCLVPIVVCEGELIVVNSRVVSEVIGLAQAGLRSLRSWLPVLVVILDSTLISSDL